MQSAGTRSTAREADLGTIDLFPETGHTAWQIAMGAEHCPGCESLVSVEAESSTAGSASFDLGVTLVEETFADLADGDYELTITGTLTAK